MATVVITFFLLTIFCVCKMDAECIPSRRDRALSRREKRWSMNSQRLEEIVAELMKPISDVRRSFDTDLSALLEEYLTEAGLHALDAQEDGAEVATPNFAELAMLLQQSASLYGRKVDFLYQHVISVSESLHNSTQELSAPSGEDEPQTPTANKRRRRTTGEGLADGAFTEIEVESSVGACREIGTARPPPTLPRMYIELEPRVLTDADAPLQDYQGEPIGLLTDFHVTWRLQEGLLVEELEDGPCESGVGLRPLSLVELQQALEASAPPLPPPHPPPLGASTPLPPETPPGSPPPLPPKVKLERKRKNEFSIDDILDRRVKLVVATELSRKLRKVDEFSIPSEWISKVVEERKARILGLRRRLRAHQPRPPNIQFLGFDLASPVDMGGFCGWSESEAVVASESAKGLALCARLEVDSDDDGFFEQSSLGDSDGSRAEDTTLNHTHSSTLGESSADWASWQAQVVRRAAEGEARGGVDVRRLGGAILGACQAQAPHHTPFLTLLSHEAKDQVDVSRLLLTTLFLANAGNVEIIQGPPMSVDTFSLRLVSTDQRLFSAAAAADADVTFLAS